MIEDAAHPPAGPARRPPTHRARARRGRAGGAGRRGWRGRVLVPSLVAGVGLALSLPPWGLWVLAFPAAGLLWWRLGGLRRRARILAGFACGLGMFVPGLWWATNFNTYGGIVLMVVEALAPALACAVVPGGTRGRATVLAGAMVLVEALRSTWPFGGLPMGGVALGQAAAPLAGAARLGGPLLLVGLVWLGGSGLALLAAAAWTRLAPAGRRVPGDPGHDPVGTGPGTAPEPSGRGRPGRPRPLRHDIRTGTTITGWSPAASRSPVAGRLVAGALALAAVAGLGAWGAAAADGGPAVGVLRVAAIQGGGARGVRQSESDPVAAYDAQFAATGEIAAHDGGRPPTLVLWPEDVVALDGPLVGSPQEGQLSALAARLRATLVVGVTEDEPGRRFRNEADAFSPAGRLVASVEKVHRVPFGEYVPDRGFFSHLADLSAVPRDAVPGRGDEVLHTPAGALGTLISYEVFYAGRGHVSVGAGAGLLVVPTNTTSYVTSQVPTQEIAAARLQAVAEGRDLLQADPTGFSALVDHRGAVLARSGLGVRAVVVGDLALRRGATLFQRGGDVAVLVAAGVAVVAGWLLAGTDTSEHRRPRRRRSRRAHGAGGGGTPAGPGAAPAARTR